MTEQEPAENIAGATSPDPVPADADTSKSVTLTWPGSLANPRRTQL